MRRFWIALVIAFLSFGQAGCGGSDAVQGCGATFPAPLYKRWFLEFYRRNPDIRVNYQAIGSGAGIQQFEEGLVHFGASDESLKPDRLKSIAKKLTEADGYEVELIQVPLTAGSVAVCYNIPGQGNDKAPVKLTRKAYIGMLLGEIDYWDDPAIQNANPDITLPHQKVFFVRRADAGGTTFVFTNHLNAIDPRWTTDKGGPGVGKSVQWPIGIGGKGNAGVNALIQQTPGAFGYIEAGYAELTKLPMAALENRSGQFALPTGSSAREALNEAKFNDVLGATIADPKSASAYPIVSFTWVVCRKKYRDPSHAAKVKDLLLFCLSTAANEGQDLSEQLGYVPLPPDAIARARQAVNEIRTE